MRHLSRIFPALILAAGICPAIHAENATPGGLWKTIDDDSGKPKSLVRIVDKKGVLEGRIEKILDPDEPADARCEACTDERRNQAIVGLLIIRNMRPAPGKAGQWEGGDILDPEDGKIYRLLLVPSADGKKLDVRGYLGFSLFGRTQTWLRAD